MPNNRVIVWVGVTSALGIAGLTLWLLSPGESLVGSGRKEAGCVADGDAQCVYSLMEERERNVQGITESNLSALLRNYVLPSYRERTGSGKWNIITLKDQGEAVVVLQWKRTGKPDLSIAASAAATPGGARSVNTVRTIIFHAFDARYRKNPSEAAILVAIDGMTRDSKLLTSMGFRGIYNPELGVVEDWNSMIASYKQKAIEHGVLTAGP